MHEIGIVQSLIEKIIRILEEKSFKKVHEIEFSLGEKSGIKEEEFRFCFENLSKGTILEGVKIKINLLENSSLVGVDSILAE
jgi:hydrogenase nickel incorporation protein HypA/HybF